MELDFTHPHNPNLFGSLSVSPPASMFDSFSPLHHFNDEFFNDLNLTGTTPTTATTNSTTDDDADDWLKPLVLDQLLEHDFLSQPFFNENFDVQNETKVFEEEKKKIVSFNPILLNEKYFSSTQISQQPLRENETFDLFSIRSSEQQIPSTTTVRVIHQPKIETSELPTTLYVSGNEFQFHPIVTTNNSSTKTIGHTFTSKKKTIFSENFRSNIFISATTSSPIPSVPIVPARVLKGKKFKRGGRMASRASVVKKRFIF